MKNAQQRGCRAFYGLCGKAAVSVVCIVATITMSSSAATGNDVGAANPALGPDTDAPPAGEGLEVAQFGAGCFWSMELTYQRLAAMVRTEVGYSQGHHTEPTYELVCAHGTGHAEVVLLHYDPKVCSYTRLLDVFWAKINPTPHHAQCSGASSGHAASSVLHHGAQTP
jgi:peptide-methionine (S)-S-oxide reductase